MYATILPMYTYYLFTLSRTYEEVVLLSPSSFSILLEGLHVICWCWVRLLPRKFDTLNLLDLLDFLVCQCKN